MRKLEIKSSQENKYICLYNLINLKNSEKYNFTIYVNYN